MDYGLSSKTSAPRFWELAEKLPVMIGITDNNEGINEFYKLIEPDVLKMPKGKNKHHGRNFWSLKTVTFVVEKMQQVKILLCFLCRADKNRQF